MRRSCRSSAAAIEFLAGIGHRRIGHVSGPADLVHTVERSATIREVARLLDLDVRTAEADYTATAGTSAVAGLLDVVDPPTAVIFDNDVMAVAALEFLTGSGVAVPGDVSLMSADDSPLCELTVPPLSAMSLDVHHRGERLGTAVLALLAGGDARQPPSPPSQVLERETTAPPASGRAGGG